VTKPRMPNVGEVVAVEWVDSGLNTGFMSRVDARAEKLVRTRTFGRVVEVDSERLLIAQEEDDAGDRGSYGLIWIPSIVKVRRFKQ